MRVLFVTEAFPYPLDTGGNVRTFNLLKGLAREHHVTLLTTHDQPISHECLHAMSPICEEIVLVGRRSPTFLGELRSLARSVFTKIPFLIERHVNPQVTAAIRQLLLAPRRFEAVHFNHLDAAIYAPLVPDGIFTILDQHNVVTNQLRSSLLLERHPLRRMVLNGDLHRLERYEPAVCDRMSLVFTCSESDSQALRNLGSDGNLEVIPNGVDLNHFVVSAPSEVDPPEVVFFGTLDYPPCDVAVCHFLERILPLIRRHMPQVRFVVVGKNPSQAVRRLAESNQPVTLTGRVQDIRPVVQRAGVCVVPLLSGSGTRLKILEAMAMGVPVVSTTIGAEGLGASHDEHLLIADSPEAFAAATIRILSDQATAARISNNGRRFVERHFSWDSIQIRQLGAYRQLGARSEEATSRSLRQISDHQRAQGIGSP